MTHSQLVYYLWEACDSQHSDAFPSVYSNLTKLEKYDDIMDHPSCKNADRGQFERGDFFICLKTLKLVMLARMNENYREETM